MHKIGFSVETIDDERRDELLSGLSELFTRVLRDADEVKIRFEQRRAYLRNGKGGTWREIKLEGGDFSFELIELGILSTQRAMDLDGETDDDKPSTDETDDVEQHEPIVTPPPWLPALLTDGTIVEAEVIVDDTPDSWLDDDELRQLRERKTEAIGI